jgi:hypothetical protein
VTSGEIIGALVSAVAHADGFTENALLGEGRRWRLSLSRTKVWHLAHKAGVIDKDIGAYFERDRSTVTDARLRFEERVEASAELRANLSWIESALHNGARRAA